MAQEVHELAVRITPEGISETSDELAGMSGEFEDTAESAGESASLLEDFSEQFQGAAGVVIAGLGVAAAGLLSQIPVIGEAMSGLFSILDSLILRIDEQLRPAIQPVTDAFFNFANSVVELDGPLGSILDTLLVASVVFLGLIAFVGLLVGAFVAVSAIASVVGTTVLVLVAILGALSLAVGVLATMWTENWLGIQEITAGVVDFIMGLITGFVGIITGVWDFFMAILEGRWGDAWMMIRDVALNFANIVHGIVVDLVNGIINRVNSAISAIESLINSAARASSGVLGVNINRVNLGRIDRLEGGPLFDTRARSRRSAGRGGGGGEGGQISQLIAALQNNEQTFNVNLDGRTVARQTKPFIEEQTSNQGRSNPL